MSDKKLKLVLCWHMHQPEYRDMQSGEFKLPWTYLHVIKDYVDMVAHLEATPAAKAVVNFAPILLEQIEDYSNQVSGYLHDRIAIKDPLLAALVEPSVSADPEKRLKLLRDCRKANRERQIERYPAFRKLIDMADWIEAHQDSVNYLNAQFISDILVWYHLVWMGETVKLNDNRVKRLIEKGSGFSLHDRIEIVEIIGDLLSKVIYRYKALARKGRIELSVTPYAHPIMPLMLEIDSAREAMPGVILPAISHYPGGEERVRWHLQKGLATFRHFFGFEPQGCWPSEGSVSQRTLQVLADFGFKWAASGGNVLHNSIRACGIGEAVSVHRPFKLGSAEIACFFRDDGLSDLIGFEYSKWHADDAVADLIQHLENIADYEKQSPLVSIIMDGENAWEYFPDNGYHFLSALYKRLSEHPRIELTTFSEYLDSAAPEAGFLPKLVAGSWVYGTFSTWIGDADKNCGWDMLGDVKIAFDKAVANGNLSEQQLAVAQVQLGVCEGSDWFWWFGDYNPGEAVSDFEKQYRLNLSNLYRLLGEEPPPYLALSFTQGSGSPAMGGAMRRGNQL
ncbi:MULTISPECIES: glycoside hydrolase family 57 protein [Methylomonas]|uniref:Glycoside hydrolase n=2 Tax=Methylomonas TaxID=416 RepID=A0A126T6F6_9GAMM|nr:MULTISPECIES: glycoside hydrolase family 57 protein [Methylomonas]AMK77638.1 glycoside hydrolase [Methylomonas denitrificans]OAH96866.1 glycoside hydrolase [Methylomonas methanica]TCV86808.1 alpha-amylase/alpha-mannosidase (GH57 family) [Methylomonas methanica]